MNDINCGSCRACCVGDKVALDPAHDDMPALRWHWERVDATRAVAVLDRKPNGECSYLSDAGCTIHASKPIRCKRFDCRELFLRVPKAQRRIWIAKNSTMRTVFSAGRSRLKTLSAKDY